MLKNPCNVDVGCIDHQTVGKVSLRMLKLSKATKDALAAAKAWSISGDQDRAGLEPCKALMRGSKKTAAP